MKINLLSSILILSIFLLFANFKFLEHIQGQTAYASSSIILNDAYATEGHDAPLNNHIAPENFTESEIKLLKELVKRREQLDKEQQDLDLREKVLKATEIKIEKKILDLKNLQFKLEELIKQYNQKETDKLLSLVKIYEAMKPKEAAKIFNELEISILLRIVSNMKQIKVAPILTCMDTAIARQLSIELTKQNPIE